MFGIGAGAHAVDLEHGLLRRRGRRDIERLQIAADHQADHGVMADLAAIEFADHAAVAQDDDAVGAFLDLVEAMRNEDDADAAQL